MKCLTVIILTTSGFVFRMQGYRLISGLVARPWCLIEIISRPEIIDIVTDTLAETNKIGLYQFHFSLIQKAFIIFNPRSLCEIYMGLAGMEARHKCCETVSRAFTSSSKLLNDPAYSGLASKVRS